MKKIVLAAFAAAVAFPAAAAPGDTDSATGTANAQIVAPISIVHTGTALDFGIIITDNSAGTVTVGVGGTVTNNSGGATPFGGTTAADEFTVSGDDGRNYGISFGTATLTGSNGGTMTAQPFAASASGTLTGGSDIVAVGGTLNVGVSQPGGTYTGTYTATASYQ